MRNDLISKISKENGKSCTKSMVQYTFYFAYSKNKIKELIDEVNFSTKMVAFIMIVPLAGYAVFGTEFFGLWLHEKSAEEILQIQILSILSVAPFFASVCNYTLFLLDSVTNKLKRPVIATSIMSILSTLTTLILLYTTDLGVYAVAGVSSVYWIIKVSTFNVMVVPNCEYGENGVFMFSDCALNPKPNSEELSEIAISTAESFKQIIGKEPRIAMLSYSTYGSAKSEDVSKVQEATKLAKEKAPELVLDGEMQLDAALVPTVGASKAPGSNVAGKANTIIFPDLNAGNIGYKLVERLAKAEAYGPVCQGMAKPVNDLSRGCKADDIVGVVAITAVQAAQN